MKKQLLVGILLLALLNPVFAGQKQNLEFSGQVDDVSSYGEQGSSTQYELDARFKLDMSQVKNFKFGDSSDSVKVKGYFYLKNGYPVFKVTKIEKESSTQQETESYDEQDEYKESY